MCRPFDLGLWPASNRKPTAPFSPNPIIDVLFVLRRDLRDPAEAPLSTLSACPPCSSPGPSRVNSIATVQMLDSHRYRAFHGDFEADGLWGRSDVLVLPSRFGYPQPPDARAHALHTRRSLQSNITDVFKLGHLFNLSNTPGPRSGGKIKQTGNRSRHLQGWPKRRMEQKPLRE